MPSFEVSLAWILVAPFPLLTNILGIACILHYNPLFHSIDVAFISLLVTMATNALLLLPIPAVVGLGWADWDKDLCTFYNWLTLTLRCANTLVLLVVNVYWMASLRISKQTKMFLTSKFMKAFVFLSWFVAIVVGLVPVTGGTKLFGYFYSEECRFLPYDVDIGLFVFFVVITLVSMFWGIVSSADTLCLFHKMKEVSLKKYNAGRFHPPRQTPITQMGSNNIHARYNELEVSKELCLLVLCFTIASGFMNGIPFTVCQFLQLSGAIDSDTAEALLLWLLLVEGLLLPHFLWLLSRRYRHAAVYMFRVYVLRRKEEKELDAAACTLQSYKVNAKELATRNYASVFKSNAPTPVHGADGIQNSAFEDEKYQRPHNAEVHTSRNGGHGVMVTTTDIDDGMAPLNDLSSAAYLEACVLPPTLATTQTKSSSTEHANNISVSRGSDPSSTTNNSSKSSQGSPRKEASSREEWKERMRKRHLPAFFNNSQDENGESADAYRIYDEVYENGNKDVPVPSSRRTALKDTKNPFNASVESTYYMSSDYHYDYINDPSPHVEERGFSSGGDSYGDKDIDHVLDKKIAIHTTLSPINQRSTGNVRPGDFISGQSADDMVAKVSAYSNILTSSDRSSPDGNSNEASDQGSDKTERIETKESKLRIHQVQNPSPVESVNQPKAVPRIRRDNYRKYLLSSNLVVSRVEDDPGLVTEDTKDYATISDSVDRIHDNTGVVGYVTFSKGDGGIHGGKTEEKDSSITRSREGKETGLELVKESALEKELGKESGKHPSLEWGKQSAIVKELGKEFRKQSGLGLVKELEEDLGKELGKGLGKETIKPVQDYNQLEGVSEAELLKLRTTPIRAAPAVEYVDETTDDECGRSDDSLDDTLDDHVTGLSVWRTQNRLNESSDTSHTETATEDLNEDHNDQFYSGEGRGNKSKPVSNGVWNGGTGNEGVLISLNAESHSQNNLTGHDRTENQYNDPDSSFTSESFNILSHNLNNIIQHPSNNNSSILDLDALRNTQINEDLLNISNEPPLKHQVPPENSKSYFSITSPQPANSGIPVKAPVPIMKPPRHKREINNTEPLADFRQASSEDELDSIFLQGRSTTEVPIATDRAPTRNDVSDQSVVLEPYGRRRPAWLDDSMESTSGAGDQVVFQSHYFPNESETDSKAHKSGIPSSFQFPTAHNEQNMPIELNYDPVTRSVSRENTQNNTDLQAVQYNFNEEIERGFEDALAIDYITHNNTYSSMGLCFESIKEESEFGSDSTSSLSHNDSTSAVFKTQAVIPGSATNSLVDIREEIAQIDDEQKSPAIHESNISNSYPRMFFPRTSADGGDGSLLNGYGGGYSQSRPVGSSWEASGSPVRSPDKRLAPSSNELPSNELPSNELPSNGQISSTSPWADIDHVPHRMKLDDMSFGSDFSQQSDDEILNGPKGDSSANTRLEPLSSFSFESAYF